jgi:hypothetical protein
MNSGSLWITLLIDKLNYSFTRERRGQKKPEKAEAVAFITGFSPLKRESKKFGDNSD